MAQTVIGNLQVRLTAVTSQFTKGMGDAGNTVAKFSKIMNTDVTAALTRGAGALTGGFIKAITSIPRLIGAALSAVLKFGTYLAGGFIAAVTAAGGALFFLGKRAAENIDRLRNLSISTGIATETMAVLDFAARESATSIESITGVIFKFGKKISEASLEVGKSHGAFDELGLKIEDLIKLKPEEAFFKAAESLKGITNQSDKSRLAIALFGKAAKDILPFFNEDLKESERLVRVLGRSFSRLDANKISDMRDAVARVRQIFEGFGYYVAITFAPLIEKISNDLLKYIERQGGVAKIAEDNFKRLESVAIGVINNIGKGMEKIRTFTGTFGITRNTPANLVNDFVDAMKGSFSFVGEWQARVALGWNQIAVAVISSVSAVEEFGLGINNIFNKIDPKGFLNKDRESEINRAKIRIASLANDIIILKREMEEARGVLANPDNNPFAPTIQSIEEMRSGLLSIAETLGFAFASTWKNIETGAKNLKDGAISDLINSMSVWIAAIEPVDDAYNTAADAIRYFNQVRGKGPSEYVRDFISKTKTGTDEIQRIWERTADSIADSLAASLLRGENAFKSLASVALSVIEQILSAFLRTSIISPLLSALGVPGIAGDPFSGVSTKSSIDGGAIVAKDSGGVIIENNFYAPVGSEDAISQAVREGIVKNRDIVGNISEERSRQRFGRSRTSFLAGA